MPRLVLGPILRSVEGARATVWVETDAACAVTVAAGAASGAGRTTAVAGRHYALVVVDGLPPATATPYRVALDGVEVWPSAGERASGVASIAGERASGVAGIAGERASGVAGIAGERASGAGRTGADGYPPSVIRTADETRPLRVVFGSCRLEAPLDGVWEHGPDDPEPGHGVDALEALAAEVAGSDVGEWPDLLAMLGDQLYADLVVHDPPVHDGPDAPPPGSLADLADFVRVYHRTWGHPSVRWLLSTVPTAMIFDDHDVIDDWNLSARWLDEIDRQPWWDGRITGGLVSYWIYQHWGNLTPSQLEDDVLARAVAAGDDATDLLLGQVDGWRLDRADPTTQRWSTTRDLDGTGSARLVLADTRNSRHLVEGERAVVDAVEMDWVADRCRVDRDDVDHLLLGSSLPWLLPVGVHHLERWGEALGAGRWGRPGRRFAERFRAGNDTEHWPSFGRSFDQLAALLRSVGSGEHGPAPATALVLSGDVHFSYLAPAEVEGDTVVAQLVSSPFRHGVAKGLRRKLLLASSRVGAWGAKVVRLTAAPGRDPVRWSLTGGPWFGNGLATLVLDGRAATVTFSRSQRTPGGRAFLDPVHEERLSS